jgi:transcriptional regulator with XRE-family HTH domain
MSSIASREQNQRFGQRLAAVRATTGLSQTAFAQTLGLSLRAYANYERGEREAPVALFRAILEQHGIDPIWLLSGTDEIPQKAAARLMDFDFVDRMSQAINERLSASGKRLKQEQRNSVLRALYEMSLEKGEPSESDIKRLLSVAVSK